MRTVAIYQQLNGGMTRIGTFTTKNAASIREVSKQFHAKHPRAFEAGPLFIARRVRICGRYVDDSQRIPMESPQ